MRWIYLGLFLAGLLVCALAGLLERAPGYMDAEYYYMGGVNLAQGKGFYQPVLWNYLDDPTAIPHPSHTYWMPMVSLLAALGALTGGQFAAARGMFILLGGLLPPGAAFLGFRVHNNPRWALLGGLFALFPVYYLAYLPTTDSFPLYMGLGGAVLLLAAGKRQPILRIFLMGLLVGLMHLTRADGVLWGAAILFCLVWESKQYPGGNAERLAWGAALAMAALAGYLFPMIFWYARNLTLWDQLFPPGGGRTLWLTRYEDTFLYPASLLTPQRWLASGWQAIMGARWQAFVANLESFAAVQGAVALWPFILVGLWRMRATRMVRIGVGMGLLTFGVMTLVFPFAGINGAYFHSGAALQLLLWAAAAPGIETVVDWLARVRRWQRGAAVRRYLEVLLVGTCVLLSLGLYAQKVVGSQPNQIAWNQSVGVYSAIEQRLVQLGATPCLVVMVNNPPGYYAAVGRSAVVLPFGDENSLLTVAKAYKISYLIIDANNGAYLPRLYETPGDYPGLHYLDSVGDARIYAFTVQ